MSGSIIVKPLNASLSRDLDTFSKMDPYTIVKLGAQAQSTKVCKDGGQHPSWTCVCTFRRSNEQLLEFEVWDKDELTKNDLIGQGTFAVAQLEQYATFNGHIPLNYKGKSAGNLQVSIEFIRDGVPGQFPQGPPIQAQFVSPFPNQGQQQNYVPGSAVQGQPVSQVAVGGYPQQYPQQYNPQYQYPPPQHYPPQQYPQPQYPPQQYHQPQFNYPPQQGYPQLQQPPYAVPPIQVQVHKLPTDPTCKQYDIYYVSCNGTCLIYKRHGKRKYCKHCCKKFYVCHKCAGTGVDIKRNEICKCRR